MKEYKKPFIEEEIIEIEDIMAVSGGSKSASLESDGQSVDVKNLWS